MSLLRDGLELSWVQFPYERSPNGIAHEEAGVAGVVRIVVVEQRGQMGMVPWARVDGGCGGSYLVNLATAYAVGPKQRGEGDEA